MPGVSPEVTLGYLRLLSPRPRGGVVLTAAGERLAGDPALVARVRVHAAALPPDVVHVSTDADEMLAVGRSETHVVGILVGAPVPAGLLEHDLRAALEALDATCVRRRG